MSSTEIASNPDGRAQPSSHALPGVYRSLDGVQASSGGGAGPSPRAADSAVSLNASDSADASAAHVRQRFEQLRSLRREMTGRPSTDSAPPLAPHTVALHPTTVPLATSFGLQLDRLPPDEEATHYILRTAAAERALRLQQLENDELKRLVVAQRREAAHLQEQLTRATAELSASNQTVLRQTVTLRSVTAAMDRRDAYHLIKEKRDSQEGQSPCGSLSKEAARVAELEAEVTRLKAELETAAPTKAATATAVELIDREEDDTDDMHRGGEAGPAEGNVRHGWIPAAADELQRLVHALGRLLASPSSCRHPHVVSASPFAAAPDAVFEVTLSDLAFTPTAPAPHLRGRVRQPNHPLPESVVGCHRGVLVLCGPYRVHDTLLRVTAVSRPAELSVARPYHRPASPRDDARCHFYALSDTSGLLSLRYTEVAEGDGDSDAAESAAAVASVTVRSLLACATAAPARGGDGQGLFPSHSASSSVHTVHLWKQGKVTPHGAASFTVGVRVVRPAVGDGVSGRREERVAPHVVVGSAHGSLLLTPAAQRSGRSPASAGGHSTHAAARPADAEESQTGGSQQGHRAVSSLLMSPFREDTDENTLPPPPPIAAAAPVPTQRCLSTLTSQTSQRSATSGAQAVTQASTDAPLTSSPVGIAAVSADDSAAVPSAAALPLPHSVTAVESDSPAVVEGKADETAAPSTAQATAPPLPPLVSVPLPPPAVVPTKPPNAGTRVRLHVKALHDFISSGGGEAVEELLERCALVVEVYHDGQRLIHSLPPRSNPSHAVWSDVEGSTQVLLKAGDSLRFTVREASAAGADALASAELPVSEALMEEMPEDKEVTLRAAADGTPCGTLIVSLFSLLKD